MPCPPVSRDIDYYYDSKEIMFHKLKAIDRENQINRYKMSKLFTTGTRVCEKCASSSVYGSVKKCDDCGRSFCIYEYSLPVDSCHGYCRGITYCEVCYIHIRKCINKEKYMPAEVLDIITSYLPEQEHGDDELFRDAIGADITLW